MNVHLREAEPSDVDALSVFAKRTYAEAFGHSMSTSDLAAHLKTNLSPGRFREMLREDVFLLAHRADKLIGFVQFGDAHIDDRDLDGLKIQPGDKEVRRLYVLAAFQNRGLGTSLMSAALNDPRIAGATIFLDVWKDNAGAQRFYTRYGFERVGKRAFRAASGEVTGVDLVMVRRP